MANVMLTLLHGLGLDDVQTLRRQHRDVRPDGDSEHDDGLTGLGASGLGLGDC